MNPTEIADALEAIARAPYDPQSFGLQFAEATDNAQATISRLRSGRLNKSKLPGGVLLNRKFYFLPARPGKVEEALNCIKADKMTASHKPAILLATDGDTISAECLAGGERVHFRFEEFHDYFGFFLPAAGKVRYQPAGENPVDVKATGKLAKLYDSLLRANTDWQGDTHRHDMNVFMTRLIFCLFAEDVGIFGANHFSRALFTYGGERGVHLRDAIVRVFTAMSAALSERPELPAWANEFPYVNGGLFAGRIDAPEFDLVSMRYLRDASRLDWREINPDIFGSMIQTIATVDDRSELGMHYTSVPNIMKVLGPLFLDDLDAEIKKAWDKPRPLSRLVERLGGIRVFDPACGSGNFLVVAYRELRDREVKILRRLQELKGGGEQRLWSGISISNFHGIELSDFAAETAKLSLFIAEYQAGVRFREVFGDKGDLLPLKRGGNIVCGNALRLLWSEVCPFPGEDEEVFIVGNPPFLGDGSRSDDQNADMDHVLSQHLDAHRRIDFVSCWIFKASNYIRGRRARSALVSTSSVCKGQSVGALWPHVLTNGVEIGFAHRAFKWRNNASANAAVSCVIVGLRNESRDAKLIFDGNHEATVSFINAYLVDGPSLYVRPSSQSIFNLPCMEYGNKPTDDGNLLLDPGERRALLTEYPEAARYLRRYMGSKEVLRGIERFCIWVPDEEAEAARAILPFKARFEAVAKFRAASKAAQTRPSAAYPHRFRQAQNVAGTHAIVVPIHTSEDRTVLPVDRVGADVILSNANLVLYDAPDWCIALIASRLHLVWIATICGSLEDRFRYSNTLGWNTFPVPCFTENQFATLDASARAILKTRYRHHPKTLTQLYDRQTMPDDLREVHLKNDNLLESMYIGRPFRNDTERLEKLFRLYVSKVQAMNGGAA